MLQEHLLYGPFMMTEYRPDLIHDILARLTPANVRCDLQSSVFGRASTETTTEIDTTATTNAAAVVTTDTTTSSNGVSYGDSSSAATTVHNNDDSIQFKGHVLCQKPDVSYEPSVEPHFGLQYWCDPIPAEIVQSWQNAVINGQQQQQQQTEVCTICFEVCAYNLSCSRH
jgi:hypothetical protein